MADDLGHDLAAAAFCHRLRDEIARLVDIETIAPEDLHLLGLADEVRLMRQHDRGEPVRLRKGDQAAFARHVTREIAHKMEEGWVR